MKIAIIGGGASGLFCAAYLANNLKSRDVFVDIIEKEKKVGRKILLTGNGKGNISNQNVSKEKYNDEFVSNALSSCTYEDVLTFFEERGVLLIQDEEGRVYPRSETSNTILDTIRTSYSNSFINEVLETNVERLEFLNNKIKVKGNNFNDLYDYVVITTGSKAGLNNVDERLNKGLIESTGHTLTKMYPALTPLFIKENIASLRGLRTKVLASIELDKTYTTKGEVLFKDDALSGICMFELSTHYAREMIKENKQNVKVTLDLLSEYGYDELLTKLVNMKENIANQDANSLLNGFFPKMLAKYILDSTKLDLKNKKIADLTKVELETIVKAIKKQEFNLDTKKVSKNSQVMVGGVRLNEVNSTSLESKLHNNLFFGGEVLNVDGQCGGYNLHFAFASGVLIAKNIIKRIGE